MSSRAGSRSRDGRSRTVSGASGSASSWPVAGTKESSKSSIAIRRVFIAAPVGSVDGQEIALLEDRLDLVGLQELDEGACGLRVQCALGHGDGIARLHVELPGDLVGHQLLAHPGGDVGAVDEAG